VSEIIREATKQCDFEQLLRAASNAGAVGGTISPTARAGVPVAAMGN
jgi:hypothetical protein